MICIVCSRDFDGIGGKNICAICLQAIKPDILDNSLAVLKKLQIDLAVSKNSIKICAHYFGMLDPRVDAIMKRFYEEIGTTLADISELLDQLNNLKK